MIDLDKVDHHPAITEISELMAARAQNQDLPFFRVIAAHYFGVMAATMRTRTISPIDKEVIVNNYTCAFGPSGCGKGQATNLAEKTLLGGFRERFVEETLPSVASDNMFAMATRRAIRKGTQDQDEFAGLEKQYDRYGAYMSVFDNGSAPAIKDFRQKLMLANAGSINLQVDEVGSNLLGATEALNVFLELYDQGYTKQKIKMSSAENTRYQELDGQTPSNMLIFGEPTKLFDGAEVQRSFMSFLATGYARRLMYAWGEPNKANEKLSVKERFALMANPQNDADIDKWANHFTYLADINKHGWIVEIPDDVAEEQLTYRTENERKARLLPDHDGIKRAELEHRHFKAMKLAGSLAFIDECTTMTMDHMHQAIKLVEESGSALDKILNQEEDYERLAKYLGSVGKEVTHYDLLKALPFYPKGRGQQGDLITLATAFGYQNHIVVKKRFEGAVEIFSGETLKKNDLSEIIVSHSKDIAKDYGKELASFDELHLLTQAPGYHWCNHALLEGRRKEDNAIPGFNLVVVDVDDGCSIDQAVELMKDYTFLLYTTKRHTDTEHRFRMLFPIAYELKLDAIDYRGFMDSLASWLPFKTDTSTHQRSRKWLSCETGGYHYNMPASELLLDPLPFIPRTSRNEDFQKGQKALGNLDNLERWFAEQIAQGGHRNNTILRYGMMLVDGGLDYNSAEEKILLFNNRLPDGLEPEELKRTVLVTVAKKINGAP